MSTQQSKTLDLRAPYLVKNDRKYRFSGYESNVESPLKVNKFRDNRENVVTSLTGNCKIYLLQFLKWSLGPQKGKYRILSF